MIIPQAPTPQVFVPAQAMLNADMPSQHFPPVAAIKANHILVAHRLPYRYSRCQNFLGLSGLPKLTKGSMYRC